MEVLLLDSSRKWLAASKLLTDDDLEAALEAFLLCDFEQAFEAMKTQKLLSRSRASGTTYLLCGRLSTWAHNHIKNRKQRERLVRHCKVTAAFQGMASWIHNETETLRIWKISFADLCLVALSRIETFAAQTSSDVGERHTNIASERATVNIAQQQRVVRARMDEVLILLNDGRRRCARVSDLDVGPEALVQALDFANCADVLMTAWDAYTFEHAQVNLQGNLLKLLKPNTRQAIRMGNYRRRHFILDVRKHALWSDEFVKRGRDLLKDAFLASRDLEGLLTSTQGVEMLMSLSVAESLIRNYQIEEISRVIDIESNLRFRRKPHKVRDLIATWTAIFTVSYLCHIWSTSVFKTIGVAPPTTTSVAAFKSACKVFLGEGFDLDSALAHFSSNPDQKEPLDLYFRPLLKQGESFVFSTSVIQTTRFERNLLSLAAREENVALSEKGIIPIARLKNLLILHAYKVLTEFPLLDLHGNLSTDVDLVALKDKCLFLFQCKICSIADTAYENWRVEQILLEAAAQMDRTMAGLPSIIKDVSKRRWIMDGDKVAVYPYLITNVLNYSGFEVGGYKVIDINSFEMSLASKQSASDFQIWIHSLSMPLIEQSKNKGVGTTTLGSHSLELSIETL